MFRNNVLAVKLGEALKQHSLIKVPANTPLPEAASIKIGSKLLRPVNRKVNGETECINVPFSKTGTNYKVFKASRYSGNPICYYTDKWIVTKPSITKSMVCFCAQKIPSDWIYFEVVGMAKNKRSCFVKPVRGTIEELLKFFTFETGHLAKEKSVPKVKQLKIEK